MKHDSQILSSDDTKLRDDQFALIVLDKESAIKLFPTEDKQSTLDSCNEYEQYIDDLGPNERLIAGKFLKEACATWDIECPSIIEANSSIAYKRNFIASEEPVSITKQAFAEEHTHYALKGKYYAIDNSELVKQACEYFLNSHSDFGLSDKRAYAKAVSRRSKELDCPSSELIEKYASDQYSDRLINQLGVRQAYAAGRFVDDYEKLAYHIGDIPVEQFADLLGRLDKKAGLSTLYKKTPILDPLAATVGIPKQAAAWSVTINGDTYYPEQLKQALSNPSVEKMYGTGMVKQLKDHPETFTSLPMTDQEDIMSYA